MHVAMMNAMTNACFIGLKWGSDKYHILQAQAELPVSCMQGLEGAAQAGVAPVQLLLLMRCICILLCLHLHTSHPTHCQAQLSRYKLIHSKHSIMGKTQLRRLVQSDSQ